MLECNNSLGLYRALQLFVIYSYQLFVDYKYIPEAIWKDEINDDEEDDEEEEEEDENKDNDSFDAIVYDLIDNGYIVRGEYEGGPGYSITDSGKALLWLHLDKIMAATMATSNDDGETMVNAVFLSLQTYVTAMRKRQMGCYDVLADDGSGWSWFPSKN